jgi:hypothetical protein
LVFGYWYLEFGIWYLVLMADCATSVALQFVIFLTTKALRALSFTKELISTRHALLLVAPRPVASRPSPCLLLLPQPPVQTSKPSPSPPKNRHSPLFDCHGYSLFRILRNKLGEETLIDVKTMETFLIHFVSGDFNCSTFAALK